MKIGIFSDVHDNLEKLNQLLTLFEKEDIRTLIFCGDFCSPIPSRVMGGYPGDVHCVFGNGDGDRFTIQKFSIKEFPNLKLHGEHGELEIDNRNIAITHYPLYGKALAKTGDYDAVFSGHTHSSSLEKYGDCVWVNPGEILGWKGKSTYAIYNTSTNLAEIFEI